MKRILGMWRRLLVRLRFTDYTIAEHFRAQGASIGQGCRLLVRDLGTEPYLVSIGARTLVSSGVAFYTHDGAAWVLRDKHPTANRFKRISVGSGCFIGAGVILLPGAVVGDRSVIGAGSVVSGEVPPNVVAAGVPARVICSVDEWAEKVLAESLPLDARFFPLDRCDRQALRTELERLIPRDGGGA